MEGSNEEELEGLVSEFEDILGRTISESVLKGGRNDSKKNKAMAKSYVIKINDEFYDKYLKRLNSLKNDPEALERLNYVAEKFPEYLDHVSGLSVFEEEEKTEEPAKDELGGTIEKIMKDIKTEAGKVEEEKEKIAEEYEKIGFQEKMLKARTRAISSELEINAHEFYKDMINLSQLLAVCEEDWELYDRDIEESQRKMKTFTYFSDFFKEKGLTAVAEALELYRKPEGLKDVPYEKIAMALSELSSMESFVKNIKDDRSNLIYEIDVKREEPDEEIEKLKDSILEDSKTYFPDKGLTFGYASEIFLNLSKGKYRELIKKIDLAINNKHKSKMLDLNRKLKISKGIDEERYESHVAAAGSSGPLKSRRSKKLLTHFYVKQGLEKVKENINEIIGWEEKAKEYTKDLEKELEQLSDVYPPLDALSEGIKNKWLTSNYSFDDLEPLHAFTNEFLEETITEVRKINDELAGKIEQGVGKGNPKLYVILRYLPETVSVGDAQMPIDIKSAPEISLVYKGEAIDGVKTGTYESEWGETDIPEDYLKAFKGYMIMKGVI